MVYFIVDVAGGGVPAVLVFAVVAAVVSVSSSRLRPRKRKTIRENLSFFV